MKIIIIKRDKIGDMLLTFPMLEHLRKNMPTAEVHVLANDYNAWVLEGNPDIDRVWIYGRIHQGGKFRFAAFLKQLIMFAKLRLAGFDVVVIGNGSESSRAIQRGLWIGGKRTIAYCNSPALAARLTSPLLSPGVTVHECDRLLSLLQPLDIKPPATALFPKLTIAAPALNQARAWRMNNNISDKPYVIIGLGARREKKQPSAQQIVRWSTHVKNKLGLETILTWTPGGAGNSLYPGDDRIAETVLAEGLAFIHPFRGTPVSNPAEFGAALQTLLGLMWQAKCNVFPDSGLMHFAAASPGGVLGLFADIEISASPAEWGPRGEHVDFVVAEHSISDLEDHVVLDKLEQLIQ